jgi:putative exosortase-associated protein (TIGR04073 family)
MKGRVLWVVCVLTVALIGNSGTAFAAQDTGALVVTKLFRGMVNAATGWMEVPKQMSLTWQESGPAVGASWGLIKGISYAIARSVAGGYEVATFLLPIPEDYKPLMQPEYVLSDLPKKSADLR